MASGIGSQLLISGIMAVVLSGIVNGTFLYPMRLLKGWKWEHAWLVFCLLGLLLLPVAVAFLAVPSLLEVYRRCASSTLTVALLLGLGWGCGTLLFGLGISALGLSLGNAIVMGTMAVFGTLVPALVLEPDMFGTMRGFQVVVSLALIIVGVMLSARAGRMRDRIAGSGAPSFRILRNTTFKRGLILCLLSGVLSACFNVGFALTTGISKAAEQLGAAPTESSFAIWAIVMGSGAVPNLAYCWYLIDKEASRGQFRSGFSNWLYVVIMSCLWVLSVALYGTGAIYIGARGATVAWPILVSSTIISATFLGLITAEWRGADWRVRIYLYAGVAALLGAVLLASLSGVA